MAALLVHITHAGMLLYLRDRVKKDFIFITKHSMCVWIPQNKGKCNLGDDAIQGFGILRLKGTQDVLSHCNRICESKYCKAFPKQQRLVH